MIRLFLGYPGGGKSYGSLLDAVDEAVLGERCICTNLSILPGVLNEYIQRRFPHSEFDPNTRLRLLTEQETQRFWLHRRPGISVPDVTPEQELRREFFHIPEELKDCLYIIDEAHIHFDARSWAENGRSLTYYNSQHRKFRDEAIFVTQFSELLDKRVRGFAAEWWYFRNRGMERMMTWFKMPQYFTVAVYHGQKTVGNIPMARHRYRLDPQLAAAYDTSAGVGIVGRRKPEKPRVKGFPIYMIAFPILAVALLGFYGPEALVKYTVGSGAKRAPVSQDTAVPGEVLAGQTGQNLAAGNLRSQHVDNSTKFPATPLPQPVWVRSVAYRGRDAIVALSDGREITRANGLHSITEAFVNMTDGTRYQRFRAGSLPKQNPQATEARADTPAGHE